MMRIISYTLALCAGLIFVSCKETQSKTPTNVPIATQADTPINEVSLLFIGDVMQHGPNIRAAFVDSLNTYDYTACFAPMAPVALSVDFAIANLELTLAGEPYTGYPQFSAPDQLAVGLKNAGIRYLVTANNHSCDRGKKGIERTLDVLDSLGIVRTGTFKNEADRKKNNLMVLTKNGLKIALINYTYGTNGIPVPEPTIVNLIDSNIIAADIKAAKKLKPDAIVVFVHWGDEYQPLPNAYQKNFANYFLKQGANYVIGSHPHVLQPMEKRYDSIAKKEQIVVYSLGNFISNQRERYKDGGAMFKLVLKKENTTTTIKEAGYILNWVDKLSDGEKSSFAIYPTSLYSNDTATLTQPSLEKLSVFETDSRALFNQHNKNIGEYVWDASTKKWVLK